MIASRTCWARLRKVLADCLIWPSTRAGGNVQAARAYLTYPSGVVVEESEMIQENNILCIYHGNWQMDLEQLGLYGKGFQMPFFMLGYANTLPPDCSNKDVFLVDFHTT